MDLVAVVGGVEYDLNDGATYRLVAHDGLGMAPLHRLPVRGPMQHGESDQGFRLDARSFSLVWEVVAPSGTPSGLYDARDFLLRVLKPLETAVALKFTLANGDVKLIDAHAVDAPMGHDAGERYAELRVGAQFQAPDPTFYSLAEESVTFALGGGTQGFTIPLPIPWPIGQSTLDQTRTIGYAGSWRAAPIIKIQGPITDCRIENVTTGEKLDFTDHTISDGDYYEIDTRFGYKTVTDSGGYNKISALTGDSDLATFHLAEPPGGESMRNNDIRVTGQVVNEATEVFFRYRVRWMGL